MAVETLEFAICQVMIAIGFVLGGASPCIYRHLKNQPRVWVHRDDFVPVGYIINVKCFFAKLQEVWVITNRGILGLTGYHDCVQSIWVLGRLVERTADDMTWEGDPRHAELTRKSFGVTGRSVATPGVRDKLDDIEGEVPIGKEAADRIAPTPCVHSISPVTDPKYRSTARTWHARCNNRRILMKCDSGDWLVFSECVRAWFGCSCGKSVSHAQNPGVTRTMLAVFEPGRVFLVVR